MQETVIPVVSIIVPSHREPYIEDLISSCNDTVWESVPVEIIIVADYPVDHLENTYPHVRWLHVPDKSISRKRNAGITAARGTICAFIDDDCRPAEKWIVHAVAYLNNHPDMIGVEGLTEIVAEDIRAGAYKEFKRLEKRGYRTNNIFYRRETLLVVNMFDERFTVQREDVDLAYSLIEAGHSIGYSSDIHVAHRFRKNEKWDLLKNCINRRFDPLLFRKHKQLYRKQIGMPYPPNILMVFIAHLLLIGSIISLSNTLVLFAAIDFCIIVAATTRRAGLPFVNNPIQWVREFISFLISPFVLFGALLYGSIRFRYVFLI